MKKKRKFLRKKKKKFSPIPLLFCAAAILAIDALFFLWLHFSTESTEPDISMEFPTVQTAPTIESTAPLETESTAPLPTETIPPETGPQILPYFAQMAEQNPDMVGWIKIDNTKLDYPIMFTPDNEEKYLHKNFEGNFSVGGLPFISASCCLGPRSDNLIVYGHNMANGTMFNTLLKYEQINYWREHPIIHVSSLYEEKEYEIIAAFYDRVYQKTEKTFKFYQFIDADSEEAYDEAISYYKKHALYDTGVDSTYGDKLITLVTCAYHVDNGRFVVVAKEKA